MTRTSISLVVGLAVAAMALLTAGVFAASVRVEQYRHPTRPEFRDFNKLFLDGVKDGLISYNEYLVAEKREPAFCLPRSLALTLEQANDIMLRWVEKQSQNTDNLPISIALLFGLQETFPCK